VDKRSRTILPLPGMRWRGLTLQVFLFAILPVAILVVGGVIYSQSLHHKAMVNLVAERNQRAVQTVANAISEQMDARVRDLQATARLIEEGVNSGTQISGLEWLLQDFDAGIALYDPSGGQTAVVSAADWVQTLPIDQPNFWAQVKASQPGNAVFTTILPPSNNIVALVGTRLKNESLLIGGFLPARFIQETASSIVTNQTSHLLVVGSGATIIYFSGEPVILGEIQAHPGVAEAMRGESGVNTQSGGHHGDQVTAFSFIPGPDWGLVLTENWEEITTPFLSRTQSAPLILIPILILALVALWFGARQIVQPLQELEVRTTRLARGDFEAVKDSVGGIAEIMHLQSVLADTAGDLRSAQEALRSYIGSITDGVESERRGLARELHDDTLQALIALNQRVHLAREAADTEEERNSLDELQQMTGQAMQNLRRMVRGLRPIYLDDLGLPAALEMLVKESQGSVGQTIEYSTRGVPRRCEPDVELALYRIAQEAVTNAVKHSKAGQIRVRLEFQPESLQLTVEDDGRGFTLPMSVDEFARGGHFGLLGMNERAELIGARLGVESQPGHGTRISVSLQTKESTSRQS